MVIQILSSAYHGMRDWLLQRGTAVVMALYSVLFALLVMVRQPSKFDAWKGLFDSGWMRIATFVFLLSLLLHAWIGVKDIFIDYIKSTPLRLTLQSAAALSLIVYAAWSVQILWGF